MANHEDGDPRESVIEKIWQLVAGGDLRQALDKTNALLQAQPNVAEGWYIASHIVLMLPNPAKALELIERAIGLDVEAHHFLIQKAQCLLALGQPEQAFELSNALAKKQFDIANHCAALGDLFAALERYELAETWYQNAITKDSTNGTYSYNLAAVQRFLGKLDEAERACDRALECNQSDFEAWELRSDLRKQSPDHNHVAALEARLHQPTDNWRGRVKLGFALAKELEDLKRYDESFSRLKAAADEKAEHTQYAVERDEATIAKIIEVFGASVFESQPQACNSSKPIFIIGMPRTGTTLLERILSSHRDVSTAGELNDFALSLTELVQQKNRTGQPLHRDAFVAATANLDFRILGERYLQRSQFMAGSSQYFIDKMPLNYLYAGLIHLALPNAKIIHVKRHPLDTCYAVYKRLFRDAYPFSYDLEQMGRYFVAYNKLMEHWLATIPLAIHQVEYESMVSDTENEIRRALAFCNLPWDEQCLQFYDNKSASNTASASQIREPAHQESVAKWKRYESQLEPVKRILDEAGIAY